MASFLRPTTLMANLSRMTLGPAATSSSSSSTSRAMMLLSSSSLSLASSSSLSSSPSSSSHAHPLPLFQPRMQARHKALMPRRTKYRKAHKGRLPIALGGSTKATTLEWGDFGLRVNEPCRLSAKHLETAEAALKRGLKTVRGSKVYLRVFPDIPVCIKGNETRMGKGKGTFEFWACRAGVGRVIFEVGGPNLRPEIAHAGTLKRIGIGQSASAKLTTDLSSPNAVMKLAAAKLPVTTEIIDKTSPPRVGYTTIGTIVKTPKIIKKGELDALASLGVGATMTSAELKGDVAAAVEDTVVA
ncbi:BZ3500_MvSof-1268-A1-R1_Chr9g10515 [Microbotryum saponariae]|uniref:BZ3500_MvSof-1268-A1-R1_Chr9g10515 protein n=1 Tax=Microbotryum saponariae TaxID=289078 RepID=A0A2X0L247_9BASI|nr:BZ3501_MvSof-1269-A2-R1_Chr9g10264 [Microbotryum saponariae]SDA00225.1 BZ3500_MvSof-1268-A1-R1_Chr9g10515 [Microbotryum saponariae]